MIVLSNIFVLLCLILQSVDKAEGIHEAEGLSGIYVYHHQTLCGKLDLRSPPIEFTGPRSPSFHYYMLENGEVGLVGISIDVSEGTRVLPAALYCVQSFQAGLYRKMGEFICVNDPNDWKDDCIKTHCIVEESSGRIWFQCDVTVRKGNYLDSKCDNGRLTSPIESPGRRRTISYFMYNNPKELFFNGKHDGSPRTDFEAREFQSLLCVLGPGATERNDAPHTHWVCVSEVTQWSACITHYCQFEEEMDDSREYVYVARCGREAPGALNKNCYEGRYLPAPPQQQIISNLFEYFMKDDGHAYQVYTNDQKTPLPGFLYCLLGPLPFEDKTGRKFNWVCEEDPNAWDKCVGTVCTFQHVAATIVVECRNVRQLQRGNLLNRYCEGGRFTVPALHADMDTFKYVIYKEDTIHQVNADSEDLSYQSLLCVLGPYPGKPHSAPHSLWVCTFDPRLWPACIDRHCRFTREYKFLSIFKSHTIHVDCSYQTSELIDSDCYGGRFHMPLPIQFANTKTFAYYDRFYTMGKLITLDATKDSLPPYLWCVRGPEPGRPNTDKNTVWNCVTDLQRGFLECITSACHINIVANWKGEREFQYNCGTPTKSYRDNLIPSKPVCADNRIYVPAYGSPYDSYSFKATWNTIDGLLRTDSGAKAEVVGYCVLVAENKKADTPRNRWFCVKAVHNQFADLSCVDYLCEVSRAFVRGRARYSYNCGVQRLS